MIKFFVISCNRVEPHKTYSDLVVADSRDDAKAMVSAFRNYATVVEAIDSDSLLELATTLDHDTPNEIDLAWRMLEESDEQRVDRIGVVDDMTHHFPWEMLASDVKAIVYARNKDEAEALFKKEYPGVEAFSARLMADNE